jgi:hypothetical protein
MSEGMTSQSETLWAIDLNWLKTAGRSFSVLAKESLCAKCRKKLKADVMEVKEADLLKTIKGCCSQSPDFIAHGLPFQESIFRIFLANGNKPMTLGELGEQLNQRLGLDANRTSVTFLSRLMKNDQYYGIKSL